MFSDENCTAVQRRKLGEDLGFEVATAFEESFLEQRRRKRLTRHNHVILCSDGTLFGDVAPLERDR
jgi:hypothetical protein